MPWIPAPWQRIRSLSAERQGRGTHLAQIQGMRSALFLLLFSCSPLALAESSVMEGRWVVTNRVCDHNQPAREDQRIPPSSLVIAGDRVIFNMSFVMAGGQSVPVHMEGRLKDEVIILASDRTGPERAIGAVVMPYEFDYDKDQLTLESSVQDPNDRSCSLGSKLFIIYKRASPK